MSANVAESNNTDLHRTVPEENIRPTGSLFSPVIDFMGLGGLSLIVIPLLLWLPATAAPALLVLSL